MDLSFFYLYFYIYFTNHNLSVDNALTVIPSFNDITYILYVFPLYLISSFTKRLLLFDFCKDPSLYAVFNY